MLIWNLLRHSTFHLFFSIYYQLTYLVAIIKSIIKSDLCITDLQPATARQSEVSFLFQIEISNLFLFQNFSPPYQNNSFTY